MITVLQAAAASAPSLTQQLAIAILSNMLTAPFTLLTQFVFERMLLPPTRTTDVKVIGNQQLLYE